jgi:hypothetical protein
MSTPFGLSPLQLDGAVPADALSLGEHVRQCARQRGRVFGLVCLGEQVHHLLAPRFVTTVVVAAGLMALLAGCA